MRLALAMVVFYLDGMASARAAHALYSRLNVSFTHLPLTRPQWIRMQRRL